MTEIEELRGLSPEAIELVRGQVIAPASETVSARTVFFNLANHVSTIDDPHDLWTALDFVRETPTRRLSKKVTDEAQRISRALDWSFDFHLNRHAIRVTGLLMPGADDMPAFAPRPYEIPPALLSNSPSEGGWEIQRSCNWLDARVDLRLVFTDAPRWGWGKSKVPPPSSGRTIVMHLIEVRFNRDDVEQIWPGITFQLPDIAAPAGPKDNAKYARIRRVYRQLYPDGTGAEKQHNWLAALGAKVGRPNLNIKTFNNAMAAGPEEP